MTAILRLKILDSYEHYLSYKWCAVILAVLILCQTYLELVKLEQVTVTTERGQQAALFGPEVRPCTQRGWRVGWDASSLMKCKKKTSTYVYINTP